ncbi:MAG: CHRD domain-containing protein [Casimicrobium sp.]
MRSVFLELTLRKYAAAFVLSAIGLTASAVSAQIVTYRAKMDGVAESPPNSSEGFGSARAIFNVSTNTMRLIVNFSGLTGNTTIAHIHCCTTTPITGTAGVATPTPSFPGFPDGVTSGTYDRTFDMTSTSSYNAAFVTNNGGTAASAALALANGVASGRAYFNLHSTTFSGGEIRGFLELEPSLDVDVSGTGSQYHSLTDGLIMLRYMLSVTGAPLVNGALGSTATRTDPDQIKTFLDATRLAYDIDGNSNVDAATDGVLIVRYLMGIRGDALVEGALGPRATRTLPDDIANYILTLTP